MNFKGSNNIFPCPFFESLLFFISFQINILFSKLRDEHVCNVGRNNLLYFSDEKYLLTNQVQVANGVVDTKV